MNNLFFEDAFTQSGDNIDLTVNQVKASCITSTNNTFNIDSQGNIIAKSIQTVDPIGPSVNYNEILNLVYPVGSLYLSTSSASPSTLFGGTWEQIKDRFLLAAGNTYTAGSTGGEATHKLTLNEIPSHKGHLEGNAGEVDGKGTGTGIWLPRASMYYNTTYPSYGWNFANNEYYPYNVPRGGSKEHNNMPPYLTVYIWKRTS